MQFNTSMRKYFICATVILGLGYLLISYYYGSFGNLSWHFTYSCDAYEDDSQDDFTSIYNTSDSRSVAALLSQKVPVLCWVMTNPKNHMTKAIHVKRTWGKRCNKLLFMSSTTDPCLPSIGLPNVKEGRDYLWSKTKEAFKYIHEYHFEEYDWFLKADDDTYVILENLRYMLEKVEPQRPIYFGCKFKPFVKQGYMSGGAGYVLSKNALSRFIHGIHNKSMCSQSHDGSEDYEMGKCLENIGVEAGDSRDSFGRQRFLPFRPGAHLTPGNTSIKNTKWYWDFVYYPTHLGANCCSETTISFHYVPPDEMYTIDFILYHLIPYGMSRSLTSNASALREDTISRSNLSKIATYTNLTNPLRQTNNNSNFKILKILKIPNRVLDVA